MTGATSDRPALRARITVIVPHRNTPRELAACLAAIPRAVAASAEIIVVDNGSSSDRLPVTTPRALVEIVRNATNRGFAAACNQAVIRARGDLLLFLNSDAELMPDSLEALVSVLERAPELAAVGAVEQPPSGPLASPARRFLGPLDHAAGISGIPFLRCARDSLPVPTANVVEAPWLRASALLVRARVFRAVGGFDEGFFFYEEDEDLCWRLRRRGHRVAVCRDAVVRHVGGLSVSAEGAWPWLSLHRSQLRFVSRRAGRGAVWLYRLSVSLVASAKAIARPSARPRLLSLLRHLWLPATKASTTAG
jgi:GT2 family glycosyltransferase